MDGSSTYLIGVTGRSGSGKTTFVHKIQSIFGNEKISIHTMDNYYRDRHEQEKDDAGYCNFDQPQSFQRERFLKDLLQLKQGLPVELSQYQFNKAEDDTKLIIHSAPIVMIEGLFVYYYDEIRELMDYKVMLDLSYAEAYARRLHRDQTERNYEETEISHRYHEHVEPAYQEYIAPYRDDMDLIVDNTISMKIGQERLCEVIEQRLG